MVYILCVFFVTLGFWGRGIWCEDWGEVSS